MLSGLFALRSGQTSSTYFDKYQFESDPRLLAAIADRMAGLLPDEVEILAGLELGGIPIVAALSRVTGLLVAFVRREARACGTCRYAEGADMEGKSVVLIEDVVSSGGAVLDAVIQLRQYGIEPIAAVCVVDRQSGGSEELGDVGIEIRSLWTRADIEGIP